MCFRARRATYHPVATRAFGAMVAHNHPSGDPEPSAADRVLTHRLHQTLSFIDVQLLDHFVVGKSVTSMRDRKLF